MKVLFYGRLGEVIGREVEIEASDGCSVAELRCRLALKYPSAAETLGRSSACIANALVPEEHAVTNMCTVEWLPPVCGG